MPARAAMSSERAKNAVTSATMSIAGSAASRLCMTMTGTRCSATTRAMSGSRCSPHTSLTMAAPCPSAQAAISALIVSIETGTPRATAAGSTGASRSNSSSSDTGTAPPYGLVDSAPMSRMSAPSAASRCACASAAAGSMKRPPSENESGVTLRTPITIGRPRASSRCNGCSSGPARRSETAGELMRLAWRKPLHASRRGNETRQCHLLHLSPRAARLSGEKLGIAELHLVWAFALFAVAGVDRCRFADLGNRASREQELADELSETDWQHGDAVDPRRDAQQQIGDHRREDLQPNGVLVVAEELADREMLLDPAEQQFDLPSALVERGDLHGRALKIIGEQGDAAAFVAPHPDAPQRDRQPGVTLADEADLSVIDDGEAVAGPLAHGTIAGGAQAHVGLQAGDEESPGIIDFPPPVEAAIPLVIDVGHAGLDPHLPTDLDIIDVGGGDLDAVRHVGCWIVDHVHLHAAKASIPFGPFTDLAQRDRARIDQAHHRAPLLPGAAIRLFHQHRQGLRKHRGRTTCVCVPQRRTGKLADPQMVVMMGVGIEAGDQPPQPTGTAQLRVDQRHQMIPALERLVVGIGVQAIHSRLKLSPINRFKETSKDATAKAHARLLSESRQPERAGLRRLCRACTVTQ